MKSQFPVMPAARSALFCVLALAPVAFPAYAAQDPAAAEETAAVGEPIPQAPGSAAVQPVEPEPTFDINEFTVRGNTLFGNDRLADLLDDLVGADRTAADVEKGRDLLEKFYHEQGYPTVVVNIPEQSVESGAIRLQVIESKVGATHVTGNRHFPTSQILAALPSLAPGAVLYVPAVQSQVGGVNRNPDLKVVPSMTPGKEPYTVDVNLKAEDQLPLHGFVELNNRNSANTTALRLNAGVHYDNLWNLRHSISAQYQMSPEKPAEVEVFSGSYTLPAPWKEEQSLVFYGVRSDSNTAFGEGFHTVGNGSIIGARYIVPLPGLASYNQSTVLGMDYKKFDEATGSAAGEIKTPIEYLPFSASYTGSLPDDHGLSLFNAGLNLSFRGAVARQESFEQKRVKSRGNYVSLTLGAERRQQLPGGFGLDLKMDGQLTDQPLISNEQYSAGGMESVRGYRESAALGDNAFHATTEFSAPDLARRAGLGERFSIVPYLFYDCAALWVKEAQAGQESATELQGAGIGVRGFLFRDLEYQLDAGFALSGNASTKSGDSLVYFKVKYQF